MTIKFIGLRYNYKSGDFNEYEIDADIYRVEV